MATRSDNAAFTHDARSRLVQYVKGGTTASYLQDPSGRRIRKTVNGIATWFLWDGTRLLAEYDAAGTRMKRYGYLNHDYAPIQWQDANGAYYVHADHLQTPRLMTHSTAQVVWRSRHQAFGQAVVEADPDGNGVAVELNMRLPGQYYDSESGAHYNYFRDYDPGFGRYVQADPIGLAGGINTYAYVGGNPISFADPTGLIAPVAAIGVGAIVGGLAQGVTTAIQGGSAGEIGFAIIGGALAGAAITAGALTGGVGGLIWGTGIGLGLDAATAGDALGGTPCR